MNNCHDFAPFDTPRLHGPIVALAIVTMLCPATSWAEHDYAGSYTGEKYLRQSLELAAPDQFGLTLPFISGIVSCLALLGLGFKYLPE